jgi:CRISPR-associated endonuclease/helicase Cas3
MTLYARVEPDEDLFDHLCAVAELASAYAPSALADVAGLAGRTHDIGKATTFFQKRLKEAATGADGPAGVLTHHAYVSGLFGAWVAYSRQLDALAVFLAIARHHGDLIAPTRLLIPKREVDPLHDFAGVARSLRRELNAVTRQVVDLRRPEVYELCIGLELPDPKPFLEGEVWTTLAALYRDAQQLLGCETRERFWRVNLLFSSLIDADKKLAAQVRRSDRREIPSSLVNRYVRELKGTSPLREFRARLCASVQARIETDPLESLWPATLTLTAPTGSGKTLAVMNAALRLRRRIGETGKEPPRIIYALPFVNIIEQNHREIQRVLRLDAGYQADPLAILTKHHHLVPIGPVRDDTAWDLESLEERLLLTEAWDAEIVVTTFVQLFHTLAGFRNRFLKKLHNIRGSIVILDEVQSLKAELWPLVRNLLGDLRDLGCTVVCMTATQPRLVSGIELAPRFDDWPTRVTVERTAVATLEDLANILEDRARNDPKSRLIVLNTVRSSLTLHKLLQGRGVRHLFYLSTNITPYERQLRILLIRRALRDRRPITLVSTQAVEAGVDLDFDEGYRDMGPLDAILQVAGRVNRHGGDAPGKLFILDIRGGGAGAVYGRILPDLTRRLLPQKASDREIEGLVAQYYDEVERRISQETSHEWLEDMARLRYCDDGAGLCSFNLIEEQPELPIFVELNRTAARVLERLRAALAERDQNRRRWLLRSLRPQMESFTITPYEQRAGHNMPPALFSGEPDLVRMDYRHIAPDQFEGFYDLATGFKWEQPGII